MDRREYSISFWLAILNLCIVLISNIL
jgi:hypothetical protein